MDNKKRFFYAAHSYMGLDYTYNSPCWLVYIFNSKKDRDSWVSKNEYSQESGNYVAMAVNAKTAYKIAPDLRKFAPEQCHRTVIEFIR